MSKEWPDTVRDMSNTYTPPVPNSATSADEKEEETADDQSIIKSKHKKRSKWPKRKPNDNYFKGKTVEMNSNVFQTLVESGNLRQFTKFICKRLVENDL